MPITRNQLAIVLVAAFTAMTVVHAQSLALTNAEVIRLVAMGVSDQTVIAVIQEAKVRQFELNEIAVGYLTISGVSTAVLAAMRQPTSTKIAGSEQLPASRGPQTLAEAAAEAKKLTHTWELSTSTGPSSSPVLPAPASPSEGTKSEGTTTGVKDEAWWRSHALALRRTLADDTTKLAAAHVHYDGLPDQAQGVLGTPIVEAWMKAKEEISRLTGIVVNDKRALADFEEEARRDNVLPGWLRER